MPELKKSDLKYTDYSWTAVPGDDPKKTKEDADRFSRKEGYEVLKLVNSINGAGGADLSIHTRQIIEWMIHEKLPSNIQGRGSVKAWVAKNFADLKPDYPF